MLEPLSNKCSSLVRLTTEMLVGNLGTTHHVATAKGNGAENQTHYVCRNDIYIQKVNQKCCKNSADK